MKPAEKHFRCAVCQRGFSRIDHLKRHHLRHSGQKPYSCVFCNAAFARCDNLRDHYSDCAQRGDRAIPETGQRGRRRHACQSCTSMKLRCDGQRPCGSCVKRNAECNNDRNARPVHASLDEGSPIDNTEIYTQPSERGSIKFLLNGGTDSFTEQFRLPPRSDRALGLVYHTEVGLQEEAGSACPFTVPGTQETRPDYTPEFIDPNSTSLEFFQDTLLGFFNGPFGDGQKTMEDAPAGQIAYPIPIPSRQDPNLAISPEQHIFEPERPFVMALIQSIMARAWTVPLDAKAQEEISANLNFLLTTARIRKLVAFYFKYWQPSCAMIHFPSFDLDAVALPLLAAMVFMGAMYSADQREVYAAKRVLDFVELYVFSSHVFSPEIEVATVFSGSPSADNEGDDWTKFQHFLAGFIITIVQYWAGSRPSRDRVMENRFSEVIKLARRLGLTQCRHTPEEQQLEMRWIQTECRIRTICVVSLLDCAFFFFQNYPCRLTYSEMECELPCQEALFKSEHPFSEPLFRFTRGITLYKALQSLFESPSAESPQQSPELRQMDFTVLDMFILIHVLFAFINTHMTLIGLLKRQGNAIQSLRLSNDSTAGRSIIPEDSILGSIRTALTRWRDHWVTLRSQVSPDEWAAMGFYRTGYNFWLVSQLLITKKDAVDVIMRMEVNCEDKLEKLKVLLADEQD